MIEAEATITIKEVDASWGATPQRWSDKGERIADMPDSEFQKLLYSLKGQFVLMVTLTCNGKRRNIKSAMFNPEDREHTLKSTIALINELMRKKILEGSL